MSRFTIVGWVVLCFDFWSLIGWLVGWLADWLACCLADWLAGWLVGSLAGWLVGLLVGWLVGWLGWLPGPPVAQENVEKKHKLKSTKT